MYGIIGFWSTNHTQQECDNLKKKLSDRYFEYKNRLDYKQNLQYWIIKYEIDNDEDITYYFEDQSVDRNDDYATNSRVESFFNKFEQFHISNDQLQDFESITDINNLENDASNHQITLSDKTISFISSASYIFNLSIDLQYNNIEFKKLFIDLGTSA